MIIAPIIMIIEMYDFKNFEIDKIVADHKVFNNFVHTSLEEAIVQLKLRRTNTALEKKLAPYFHGDIPEPLVNDFKAVLSRHLITPNYELIHFMDVIKNAGIEPVLLEYLEDKFTSKNPLKYSLGKMTFQADIANKFEKNQTQNVIEFSIFDGRKIKEIRTIWGESLIDFHHGLLEAFFPDSNKYLYDASDWFHRMGTSAIEYYSRYTALFVKNAILFENFHLEGDELRFIKSVFLPIFIDIWRTTGEKPLIVSVLPMDNHNDIFWTCYPMRILNKIKDGKKCQKMI